MTVTRMFIRRIEADLLNVTQIAGKPAFVPGNTQVEAINAHETHTWYLDPGERCWIGQQVDVPIVHLPPTAEDTYDINADPMLRHFVIAQGDTLHDASTGITYRFDGAEWQEAP